MQFKHPELLYALFLLLIPIIVHLFQLRKFQKENFTNVAFLKEVTLQTRKSSQIKKWLTLFTRLGILAAIILAFAQPFFSNKKSLNTETETVIYLDNSFSMQAKGDKGIILKRAIQELIEGIPETETLSILTNDDTYRNTSIKTITNDLLQLGFSPNQLTYNAALLKSKKLFNKDPSTIKNIVMVSDFQQKKENFEIENDSSYTINLVQLKPIKTNNIAIDTLYISKRNSSNLELTVGVNSNENMENFPVAYYNDDNLVSKTAVSSSNKNKAVFTIPTNTIINGKITIEDTSLQFDNSLFFNINEDAKTNVLVINEANDSFLKRIYTNDNYNYTAFKNNTLDYNSIDKQNLIVLNELETIPNSLVTALNAFTKNGGVVIVIPNTNSNIKAYNTFLNNFGFSPFKALNKIEKRLTTINYSHPIYSEGVFEKQINNFQYPKIQSYYPQDIVTSSAILKFEDDKPFLSQNNNVFVFSAALNKVNSNFKDINLIVPTFINIAKQSLNNANLYYTVGNANTYDVAVKLQQDGILTLEKGEQSVIPQQNYFNNKVSITTNETPIDAGIYTIKNKTKIIENVSYNYNRDESKLNYLDLSIYKNATLNSSVSKLFDTLKSDNAIHAIWKWFVIFALLLLIIEMLILKYLK